MIVTIWVLSLFVAAVSLACALFFFLALIYVVKLMAEMEQAFKRKERIAKIVTDATDEMHRTLLTAKREKIAKLEGELADIKKNAWARKVAVNHKK